MHCAHAVRKVSYFGPMAKVTAVTTVFPSTGLLRFLLSPKTQIKQCFTVETPNRCLNLLVFALCMYASLVVHGLQGGPGKPNLRMSVVPELCLSAP